MFRQIAKHEKMKKVTLTVFGISFLLAANAQDLNGMSEEILRGSTVLFVLLSLMIFVLSVIKSIIQYRLKNKIIEKGIPEHLATSVLQTSSTESKNMNVKWFSVLAGLGAGLMIVNYTQPLGIHSLAVMAFTISISFLGYYFFLKQVEK